jgi:hypothetical protein
MKKTSIILSVLAFFTICGGSVWAEELREVPSISSFQSVIEVPSIKVSVPTVVEVPLTGLMLSGERYYVLDTQTETYVGSYIKSKAVVAEVPATIETSPQVYNTSGMSDDNRDTYTEFSLPENGEGVITVLVKTPQPITTSKLQLRLSPHVALPKTIQVKSYDQATSQMQTILATKSLTDTTIYFPEVTSDHFSITLNYVQPLRISELELVQEGTLAGYLHGLRFLAQPDHTYNIYYGADQEVAVATAESGDLISDKEVMLLPPYSANVNRYYVPADIDDDGVWDTIDNCVNDVNTDQLDVDRNGRGDVCDDWDRDGLRNSEDNCVNLPNRTQVDTDYDGIGDACDMEESRFTERNSWVPWVGMATATTVLLVLFALVARNPRVKVEEKNAE